MAGGSEFSTVTPLPCRARTAESGPHKLTV
jgi:hypothetical protein